MPSHDSSEFGADRVLPRVGSLEQVAGVEMVEALEGEERGVRKALVRTGGGLRFEVLVDRGFDLGRAEFRGVNVTWRSPIGAAHPYSFQDDGWLRRFAGGLMVTCGPDNVGPPSGGRSLHGRHSGTRARLVHNHVRKDDDGHAIVLEGEIRHYTIFGVHLVVRRRITARCGGASLSVDDRIANAGSKPASLMWLYHCNFGFPLLDDGAELIVRSSIEPRDAAAGGAVADALGVQAPKGSFEEQVFFHDVEGPHVEIAVVNEQLPLAVSLSYDQRQLPQLIQWKYLRPHDYVMALEPATCRVFGYEKEKKAGRVIDLAPGEHHTTALTFEFNDSENRIRDLKTRSRRA